MDEDIFATGFIIHKEMTKKSRPIFLE